MADAQAKNIVIDWKRDGLVILASSMGTMFEWYDFFIYGTLAAIIGKTFFPADSEVAQLLLALAGFGVGFGVRPLGAIVFGYLGDRLGRKYTFLVAITLMGLATAGVGFVPSAAAIGLAAPSLLILLRALQGLALGGEYGGAAIYVAEHAPAGKRGLYTSFIQASVIGGFILSLAVVLGTTAIVGETAWNAWAWRIPFVFSLVLLALSLWIRLKLKESPVFQDMKNAGKICTNPLRESLNSRAKLGRIVAAMLGIAAGLTVVWYTAQFQVLYFLQNALRIKAETAQIYVGLAACFSLFWFILFGWLSDKIGRKKPILIGYALTLLLIFPLFHLLARIGNPELSQAMISNPVVISGSDCTYNPFATAGQKTACGKLLDNVSKKGIAYSKRLVPEGAPLSMTIGGRPVDLSTPATMDQSLAEAGYKVEKTSPDIGRGILVILTIIAMGCLSGMTFGPTASFLVELFPSRVRYTSLSIPYHVGTGYFGGFLPLISQYIVAKTGDPFAGTWYTVAVVAIALVTTAFFLPETAGKELD